MTRPEITAVLVAWNSGASLVSCVESLCLSADEAEITLSLVVVDNNSRDGSVERLALRDGDRVVRNNVNAGFGVAAAQGSAVATAAWILLLNPDVVVAPSFVGEVARVAREASARVATIVPELRFASEPDVINCRGVTMDAAGLPAEVDAGRLDDAPSDATTALGGSSGCCLVRREALVAIGGIEPCFFAYLEDVDLAVRLQRAGYEMLAAPLAIAWHEGSASTVEGSPLKTYLVARNRRILFRLDAPDTLDARLWRVVAEVGHGLYSMREGGVAPLHGRLAALRQRRYARFLGRSRRLLDPPGRSIVLAPRSTLRDTLARKRNLRRALGGHE